MQSSKDYIRNTTVIHILILLVQLSLIVASVAEIQPFKREGNGLSHSLFAGIIFLVVGIALSYYIFRKYVKESKRKRGIREKLQTYRKGLFYQWSIFMLISIVATITFLYTEQQAFIFMNIFVIVVFLINRPTINKTINDLNLDKSESRILKTPDAAI
jgi:hypothetical protein